MINHCPEDYKIIHVLHYVMFTVTFRSDFGNKCKQKNLQKPTAGAAQQPHVLNNLYKNSNEWTEKHKQRKSISQSLQMPRHSILTKKIHHLYFKIIFSLFQVPTIIPSPFIVYLTARPPPGPLKSRSEWHRPTAMALSHLGLQFQTPCFLPAQVGIKKVHEWLTVAEKGIKPRKITV